MSKTRESFKSNVSVAVSDNDVIAALAKDKHINEMLLVKALDNEEVLKGRIRELESELQKERDTSLSYIHITRELESQIRNGIIPLPKEVKSSGRLYTVKAEVVSPRVVQAVFDCLGHTLYVGFNITFTPRHSGEYPNFHMGYEKPAEKPKRVRKQSRTKKAASGSSTPASSEVKG